MEFIKKEKLDKIIRHRKNIDRAFLAFWILFFIITITYLIFVNIFWINISPSIPIGIYREVKKDKIVKGDIVVFKMNPEFEKYSSTKNMNILSAKTVVAVYGDKLEEKNNHIFVNGEDYGEYVSGIEKAKLEISKNGYWVLSKEKFSLDSRYYGEIKKNEILKKVKIVYEIKTKKRTNNNFKS